MTLQDPQDQEEQIFDRHQERILRDARETPESNYSMSINRESLAYHTVLNQALEKNDLNKNSRQSHRDKLADQAQ